MANFPYMSNPSKIKTFFEQIQSGGVPDKVTYKHLESLGYKSKNDRPLITILRYIGFIDQPGTPTEQWRAYRNREKAPVVLAKALRTAYGDLFNLYPDAHRKDREAIRNYFSTNTTVGEGALRFIVQTFYALCELAEFDSVSEDEQLAPSATIEHSKVKKDPMVPVGPSGMTVNINIELALPATEDASVYEKLFEAMKKHLMSRGKNG